MLNRFPSKSLQEHHRDFVPPTDYELKDFTFLASVARVWDECVATFGEDSRKYPTEDVVQAKFVIAFPANTLEIKVLSAPPDLDDLKASDLKLWLVDLRNGKSEGL